MAAWKGAYIRFRAQPARCARLGARCVRLLTRSLLVLWSFVSFVLLLFAVCVFVRPAITERRRQASRRWRARTGAVCAVRGVVGRLFADDASLRACVRASALADSLASHQVDDGQ